MRYGICYQGSKNRIAKDILDCLPRKRTLYDLFVGGGAVTHCAILQLKYDNYVINDQGSIVDLFIDAVHGKYKNNTQWVSREEFNAKKNTDPFIKYVWSFSSNGRDYLYSKEKEEYKKALYYSRVLKDDSLLNQFKEKDNHKDLKRLQNFENLQRLEWLQDLENIQRLDLFKNDTNITAFKGDYKDVEITDLDSVIYCDPPYRQTRGYDTKEKPSEFDYQEFYSWCENQKVPVFISEYEMPADRFKCIAEFRKRKQMFGGTISKAQYATERLFRPIRQLENNIN